MCNAQPEILRFGCRIHDSLAFYKDILHETCHQPQLERWCPAEKIFVPCKQSERQPHEKHEEDTRQSPILRGKVIDGTHDCPAIEMRSMRKKQKCTLTSVSLTASVLHNVVTSFVSRCTPFALGMLNRRFRMVLLLPDGQDIVTRVCVFRRPVDCGLCDSNDLRDRPMRACFIHQGHVGSDIS